MQATCNVLLHARAVFTERCIHDSFAQICTNMGALTTAPVDRVSWFATSACIICLSGRIGINEFPDNEVRRSNGRSAGQNLQLRHTLLLISSHFALSWYVLLRRLNSCSSFIVAGSAKNSPCCCSEVRFVSTASAPFSRCSEFEGFRGSAGQQAAPGFNAKQCGTTGLQISARFNA